MFQGETGFTTITAFWKVRWYDAVSHEEGIAELLGREFSPVDLRRENRQASTSLFSSLDGAALSVWQIV
jgi:hypothetical protein